HATVRRLVADGLVDGGDTVAGQAARLSITDHGRAQLAAAAETIAAYEVELAAQAGIPVDDLRASARTAMAGAWSLGAQPPGLD
ncbi:MAG: hypothetical protein REI11_09255, partial [Patulibacter sp.]|nr:hypothetical protein [Patulibacter sp.]